MKKFIIPVLIFTMLSSCTNEVVIDYDLEAGAIQDVVESTLGAIAELDTEKLKTYLCDDFFAYDMNQAMNLEALSNAVAGMIEMGYSDISFKVKPVESYIYEKNALACFRTSGSAKMGDQNIKMDFLESYFLIKTEEGWKVQFFHSTQLPPPVQPTEE